MECEWEHLVRATQNIPIISKIISVTGHAAQQHRRLTWPPRKRARFSATIVASEMKM